MLCWAKVVLRRWSIAYTSKTRNKLIAKAFKEIGLIEKYGSGIKRIFDICNNYGIIPPKFEEFSTGFRVTLFKEKINDTLNVVENVVENRLEKIINLIKENNQISANQIAKIFSITERTAQRDLDKLKNQNKIKRIGSDKGGHWQIIE